MVLQRSTRALALASALVIALPAAAVAKGGPAAHVAGSGPPPVNPAIVGVPIQRTDAAIADAAQAIDAGDGAQAAAALTASRRYLLRSYSGAKYLVALPPPPVAAAAAPNAQKFVRLAHRAVRASHARASRLRATGKGHRITARKAHRSIAHASGGAVAGPAFADAPTAVFNVLTSQYNAATGAIGMAPDTKGQLLATVKTTLNTAIVLRNRLVKVIHAVPPPPAAAAAAGPSAHAAGAPVATGFDTVMPGLTVLLDDELQQMDAMSKDASVPADAKAILTTAIAADTQIEALVNQFWPPVPAAG
jgi:hypothetical protein